MCVDPLLNINRAHRFHRLADDWSGQIREESRDQQDQLADLLEQTTGREGLIMTNYRLDDVGGRQPGVPSR
jgi:hypothetical protein